MSVLHYDTIATIMLYVLIQWKVLSVSVVLVTQEMDGVVMVSCIRTLAITLSNSRNFIFRKIKFLLMVFEPFFLIICF